jgi:FtsP/CotA-like multicopper oxidase with cupredoxin domain
MGCQVHEPGSESCGQMVFRMRGRPNGRKLSTPLWRDTFVLTKTTGDSLTRESNFVKFPGKFVEHCHVLAHEDLGMMGSVEVVR